MTCTSSQHQEQTRYDRLQAPENKEPRVTAYTHLLPHPFMQRFLNPDNRGSGGSTVTSQTTELTYYAFK